MLHYDAIVIGSGQAGNPLSQKLADRGWAVALVEKEHLGGTCVNTGCTPTKTMLASAQVAHYARNADRWGVRAGAVSVDLPKVIARKDRVVGRSLDGLNRKVEERQTLYANLIEGKALTTDNRPVPYAVFTDPQLGRVGLTERETRAQGRRLKIGKIPMAWVARAIERDETAGLMKLVVDAETDQILGAAILASEGGEVVQILHAIMLAGAPYTLLKGAVYIHPTLAEGLWTLMEAVTAV